MEIADFNDILNVRPIKMEHHESTFDSSENVEITDPISNIIPQYISESDLGLMQSSVEIFQTPLAMFDPNEDEDTMQSNDSGDEVIIQLMDIRTRLSKLRTMLERRLGIDLSDYTFWLQDAKMLESHKTLVEQCIRGTGVVQVNLQIRPTTKKINILDVLKPDEELTQGKEMEAQEIEEAPLDVEVQEMDDIVEVPAFSPSTNHAHAVNWVVDVQFRMDHARAMIPHDPNDWSIQHVKLWIQWAVRHFNLTGIKLSDWNINGTELCALDSVGFKEKVPSDPGDLFWTHFELLRKCKFIAIVQQTEPEVAGGPTQNKDLLVHTRSAIKKKPKQLQTIPSSSDEELIVTTSPRVGYNGQIQLWQFLLELLTSAEHYDVIRWHGTEGEFKLLEPERVARLWGSKKHKPAMNYEKLSRALRYYYDGDMIAKVAGKRFVYKFVCNLQQLIGYTPGKLAELVKEAHLNSGKSVKILPDVSERM